MNSFFRWLTLACWLTTAAVTARADDRDTAASLLQKADAEAADGNYAAAFPLYERVLALEPENQSALINYPYYLFLSGDAAKALTFAEKGYGLYPDDWYFPSNLALFHCALGKLAEGKKYYALFFGLKPDSFTIVYVYVEDLKANKEKFVSAAAHTEALDAYRGLALGSLAAFDALQGAYVKGRELARLGLEAHEKGDYQEALRRFEEALSAWKAFPLKYDTAVFLTPAAECALLIDSRERALTLADLALKALEEAGAEEHELIGRALEVKARVYDKNYRQAAAEKKTKEAAVFSRQAVACYKDAFAQYQGLRLFGRVPPLLAPFCDLLESLNDNKTYFEFVKQGYAYASALKDRRYTAVFGYRVGALLFWGNKYDEASKYLREALPALDGYQEVLLAARCRNVLAIILMLTGRADEALEYARAAYPVLFEHKLGMEAFASMMPMVSALMKKEDFKGALAVCEQGMKLAAESGNASVAASFLALTANALDRLGDKDKATAAYREALAAFKKAGMNDIYRETAKTLALLYAETGRYDDALSLYKELLVLAGRDRKEAAEIMVETGVLYRQMKRNEQALSILKQALPELLRLKAAKAAGVCCRELGTVCEQLNDFGAAAEYFDQSIGLLEPLDEPIELAHSYEYAGNLAAHLGDYSRAMALMTKALEVYQSLDDARFIALTYASLGGTSLSWGRPSDARRYYNSSLELFKKHRDENIAVNGYVGLARCFAEEGKYRESLAEYERAEAMARKNNDQTSLSTILHNESLEYMALKENTKAEQALVEAVKLTQERGDTRSLSLILNTSAVFLLNLKKGDEALKILLRSLDLARSVKDNHLLATVLHNLAMVYERLGDLERAVASYTEAVKILDGLRRSASGDVRRDFLAKSIRTHQYLSLAYVSGKKPDRALLVIEESTALSFRERLGQDAAQGLPDIAALRRSIPPGAAVLYFIPIIGPADTAVSIECIAVDAKTTSAWIIPLEKFLAGTTPEDVRVIREATGNIRGLTLKAGSKKAAALTAEGPAVSFEHIITYYRYLLSRPSDNMTAVDGMARRLYDLLLTPAESALAGKKEIILIPQGILAYLPFEALKNKQNAYLAETHIVRYIQSLSVLSRLAARTSTRKRKDLLALGNPDYSLAAAAGERPVESVDQLEALGAKARSLQQYSRSLTGIYAALGITAWEELPGTMAEIQSLKKILPQADILSGKEVNEADLKAMSSRGELAAYRIIHFATHGLVVPEMPELSALVLTLTRDKLANEGYFTMREIAGLNLDADFVCLSACETGLGRIYAGEGVVGIGQSFIEAGANSLAVSLWQVADETTARFMSGLYRLAASGRGIPAALAEMKRQFIRDPAVSHPFYWAPFVLFGR